jgi:hypothetical protein
MMNYRVLVMFFLILTVLYGCNKDEKSTNPDTSVLAISSINPTSGKVGDVIAVYGTKFGANRDTNCVSFNNLIAAEYTSWCDTEIKVKVPVGATSGKLMVSIKGQKSNAVFFTVTSINTNAPQITSVSPTTAIIGDVVSIFGSKFGAEQGTNFVAINNINATEYISWCDTEIKVKVPAGATSGKISVTVDGQKSNERFFNVKTEELIKCIDKNGKEYKFVRVCNKYWMTENLRVGKMILSPAWPALDNVSIEYYCYNNDSAYLGIYGGLYYIYTL